MKNVAGRRMRPGTPICPQKAGRGEEAGEALKSATMAD